MLNKIGKTLTIFVVLIIVLLISSTSIGFYLYHKEQRWRKNAESDLAASRANEFKLQAQLKDLQTQLGLALDKNKEADQKINSLLDAQDLNEGLRAALKKENADLKTQIETINQTKEKIKTDLDDSNAKLEQYQGFLKAAQDKSKDLEARLGRLEETKKSMEAQIMELKADLKPKDQQTSGKQNKVELGKIVINPPNGPKGRILSVDTDAQFVIFNLGLKQGVSPESVLSVFRGNAYLGDIKATRVQDEMAAADFIPPFSSSAVRKDDTVVLKP